MTVSCIRPSEDAKTKFCKDQKNSFGMAPGPEKSCPGATNGPGGCWSDGRCKVCYVWKFMQFRKNLRTNLEWNWELLSGCKGKKRVELLVHEFKRFLYDCGPEGKFYRLHWSGDIFSPSYARDLLAAIEEVPEVTFWNYTRNFDPAVVREFRRNKPANLVQYLSLDVVNIARGMKVYAKNRDLFCTSYMGTEKKPFEDALRKVDAAPVVFDCPGNRKHTGVEYMCKKCKMCLSGKSVFFRTRR